MNLSADTITRDTRPPLDSDRRGQWYAKAVRVTGLLLTGPRYTDARAYALDAMQDAEPVDCEYEH